MIFGLGFGLCPHYVEVEIVYSFTSNLSPLNHLLNYPRGDKCIKQGTLLIAEQGLVNKDSDLGFTQVCVSLSCARRHSGRSSVLVESHFTNI